MLVLRAGLGGVRFEELAFAPDGGALAGGAHLGGYVFLWTAFADGARAEVVPLPGGGGPVRPAFAPDGRTLLAGNDHIYALDLASRRTTRLPTESVCGSFALSPDGTRAVVTEYPRDGTGHRASCWAVPDLTGPLWQFPFRTLWGSSLMFVPADPDRFIQVERNTTGAHPWHGHWVTRALADASVVATSDAVVESPERVAVSPDGAWRVAVARDCIYRYPGSGRWSFVAKVGNIGRKHFTGVAFHPSGRHLAATSNDTTVKLYDTGTWELARTFTWDIGKMRSIAFSPDGTLAAAGSDKGKVVVWDVDL